MASDGNLGQPDDLDGLVTRLSALDTCVVSDALDALDLPGAVLGLRPLWESARVAGRAMTVGLAPYPGEDSVHLSVRAIEVRGLEGRTTSHRSPPTPAGTGRLTKENSR